MFNFTSEDIKMMNFAKYCIEQCGNENGCTSYNTICSDFETAKKKTLEELETELSELNS